jgi:hypothetical protein
MPSIALYGKAALSFLCEEDFRVITSPSELSSMVWIALSTNPSHNTEESLLITWQLLRWKRKNNAEMEIEDIKEQIIPIQLPEALPLERLQSFFEAWQIVLKEAFTALEKKGGEALDGLMPYDLFNYRIFDVIQLKRAHTTEDFAHALRAKTRLGRWL